MKTKFLAALVLAIALAVVAQTAMAQSLTGLWDATITFNGQDIPFRLQIAGDGSNIQGWLFNGDDKVVASGGSFQNGSLVLNFDSYAAKLEAKLQDGALVGQYGPMLKKTYPVAAHRHQADTKSNAVCSLDQWPLGSGREKLQGRAGLAAHRSAEERLECLGCDSARRRRYRRVDRQL